MASTEQFTIEQLRGIEVFRDLGEDALGWLLQVGQIRQLKPRHSWQPQDGNSAERYAFVLRGIVAITLVPASLSLVPPAPKGTKRLPKEQKYLGYFEQGACFSSAFARSPSATDGSKVDCVALNAVTLLEIERESLAQLLAIQPQWKKKVQESVELARGFFLHQQEPTRRQVQEFFLRENYITSSVIRVGRLDLCLDCNKCYDACVARHGVPRMARIGPSLGRLSFPVVCRTCEDHPCVPVCKFNAIAYHESLGEVQITDSCIGCGLCAKSCPNDAITMAPLVRSDPEAKGPKKRAVKCDHCAGYDDRACIAACPTGALIEIPPSELFKEVSRVPSGVASSFSDAPFLKGLAAPTARARRIDALKNWGTWITLLVVGWLGIESFLIRTQPERSLLHWLVQLTHSDFPVQYSSGRGIGHWYGYIGTVLMVLSCLYTLRRRVKRCESWGSKTGWLSAHLWLGFVGAALVTYHAAFKLDRWASIACYLMWIVIVTGAIGRYVYGWVHSSVGMAEFELNMLRGRCAYYAERCATPRAVAFLIGADASQRRRRWPVTVMFWEELRDRVALMWLWARGTSHLNTAEERRQMVRSFGDWAEQRRRLSYFESAKPLLRHWNIIHIVIAILMFILAGFHVVYGFIYKAV